MAHHHFIPQHYHVTIGSHEPVLHIAVGDPVATTTVDARGRDASDQQVTERGNPQTGPFYIEGAEPGDTLVLRFDHLWPNRKRGWTRMAIAPNVLDPGFRPGFVDEGELADWEVDLLKGTARLSSPPSPLGKLEMPLAPMLGCFGVAPPQGQAISTATSSTHGGNMDYRGFVQGAKVYFPVFVPGALLHVGDCHAVQGDGEIVGTGIEITAEVTFGVDLIKGRQINWPRAENEEYLMTVGNARPLDQCVQHATTEMVRWLTSDFDLDARTDHLLLGQCVQYDLGNILDPAYTMVCKVAKKVLEGIGAVRK